MIPEEGSIWKYKTGLIYRVLFLVNDGHDSPKHPREVIYQGSNGKRWSYPLSDWHDNFEPHNDTAD